MGLAGTAMPLVYINHMELDPPMIPLFIGQTSAMISLESNSKRANKRAVECNWPHR